MFNHPAVDTISASFYRIYEFYVLDDNIYFRNELEYFCIQHPTWALCDIPDPKDPDPLRYAILACVARWMVAAFNRRIGFGLPRDAPAIILNFREMENRPKIYETLPAWVERVPPMPEQVHLPDENGNVDIER